MIWSEIKDDYSDNGEVHIDAWVGENEDGATIAKIKEGVVTYIDARASIDIDAQEIIEYNVKKQIAQQAKEQALTAAIIIREDLLLGTVNQVFDKVWEIAKKFVEKYPIDTDWEEIRETTNLDWEETIIEFTKKEVLRTKNLEIAKKVQKTKEKGKTGDELIRWDEIPI
jgi:hypothetical protein